MKSWALKYQKPLILSALLVLLTILFTWMYKNITWEEVEIDRGYSKEALKNDYLAAELFLRQQGVEAISTKNFVLLDKFSWRNIPLGDKDTIILINGHKTLSQARYDKLMQWVENGGTLIASTHNPFIGNHTDAQDLLLNDFRVEIAPQIKDTGTDKSSAMDQLTDELKKLSKGNKPKKQEAEKQESDENNDLKINDLKIKDPENNDPENNPQENLSDSETTQKKSAEVDTEKTEDDKTQKKTKKKKSDKYYRCNKAQEPTTVSFHGEEKPLAFDFSQRPAFYHYANDDDKKIKPEVLHMVYFDTGEGSVTITSDNSIWKNKRIDCHDHAYGLWQLINPEGRVWFLINQDAPSLWAILWRTASYGVIAALLTLGLWLWSKSQRFGPVLTRAHCERRSLAEHIYASTMLLWRKQQHPQLVTLLRSDIMARLNQYHIQVAQASQHEQLLYLQQLTQFSTHELQQALFAEDLLHPHAFTATVACLQKIRKAL